MDQIVTYNIASVTSILVGLLIDFKRTIQPYYLKYLTNIAKYVFQVMVFLSTKNFAPVVILEINFLNLH